jgi:hypothetical protein
MFDAYNERERTETVTGRKVGRYCSASSAWRFEQGGDLSDGFGAWADVPHRGARVAVPGLGHDQLQRDTLLAEMGGRGVAQLVQLPPGVPGEQDPGAVVAEPGPSGGRAQVPGRAVPSELAEASCRPSGLNATACTP